MVARELVKAKIDHIQEEYLDILYEIVQSFESKWALGQTPNRASNDPQIDHQNWRRFVALTYGSTAAAPIERADQGSFEIREVFE